MRLSRCRGRSGRWCRGWSGRWCRGWSGRWCRGWSGRWCRGWSGRWCRGWSGRWCRGWSGRWCRGVGVGAGGGVGVGAGGGVGVGAGDGVGVGAGDDVGVGTMATPNSGVAVVADSSPHDGSRTSTNRHTNPIHIFPACLVQVTNASLLSGSPLIPLYSMSPHVQRTTGKVKVFLVNQDGLSRVSEHRKFHCA